MPSSTLYSALDQSVNFLTATPDGGLWEARYVRRVEDYFIAYLSSHTGCRQACRFCHLTSTGQTTFMPSGIPEYLAQLDQVLAHYDSLPAELPRAQRLNVNFMARGEPLANPVVLHSLPKLAQGIRSRTEDRNLALKLNVSSILPTSMGSLSLLEILGDTSEAMLYYSLYSLSPAFRKRWLPKALSGEEGLDRVAAYQQSGGSLITLHWAFIKDENDDEETIGDIIQAVLSRGIKAKFNLVRYNPFSSAQGVEPSEEIIERNFRLIADALGHPKSRIVPRVGYDVKASCGMFVASPSSRRLSSQDAVCAQS